MRTQDIITRPVRPTTPVVINAGGAIAVLALLLAPVAAHAQYTVVSLGADVVAADINNRPQIVGYDVASAELLLWDSAGRHALGVRIDTAAGLKINDHGIIVGMRVVDGAGRVFAWVDGTMYDLPPASDTVWQVRSLTNTNALLVQGLGASWMFAGGGWKNLTAMTGAEIRATDESGRMAGGTSVRALQLGPYLRYADGHVLVPWTGPPPITLLGPAGHFASSGQDAGGTPYWWFGGPDNTLTQIAEPSVLLRDYQPLDINAAGDVVGYGWWRRPSPLDPWYSMGFVRRHGITHWLPIERAVAINDAGYIVGVASGGGVVLVPAVSAPANLTFTVSNRIVTLSWQATSGVLDYIVEAGSLPGAADLYNAAIGVEPALVTAAPPGRYYVRVRARTVSGVTAASEEVVIDVP